MKSSRLSTNNPNTSWILVDEGNAYLENQALGIVEAMDLHTRLYRLSQAWYWQYVPLWIPPTIVVRAHSSPRPLCAPWPSFVLCGGEISIKMGAYLKKKHDAYVVSLGKAPSFFDKIIIESFSQSEQGNTIKTCGPVHRIHPEHLIEARMSSYRKIDHLPKPRVGLFLEGGEPMGSLVDILLYHSKMSPFSLMIYGKGLSFENQKMIEHTGIPHVLWAGEEEDPYLGFLAHSDAIIVSNASSLMMAEVSSVGKPVSIYASRPLDPYSQALITKGCATLLSKNSSLFSSVKGADFKETQRVAEILKDSLSTF